MHLSVLAALLLLSAVVSVSEGSGNVLELLVLLDDRAVYKWQRHFRENDPVKAKQDLIKYLNPSFYTLDKILQQVGVELRIVEMHFLEGRLPAVTSKSNRDYLMNFHKTLQGRNLPPRDHALFLTGHDLTTTGFTWTGTMCTNNSESVVELAFEGFDILMSSLMAHELGHSFGCEHDNDRCVQKPEGSIMNGVVMPGGRAFRYSSCCTTVVQSFLRSEAGSCLRKISASAIRIPSVPFGQVYSADVLCSMAFGDQFYLAREYYEKEGQLPDLCDAMWCATPPAANGEIHYRMMSGIDGAVCADRKVCNIGKCTGSSPASPGACPFGDSPPRAPVHEGRNCQELKTAGDFSFCYDNRKANACCVTCEAAKDTQNPDCFYGDRNKQECTNLHPAKCRTSYYREMCCATCRALDTHVEGCRFGDGEDCVNLERASCYHESVRENCCDTCKRMAGNITDCIYGDKNKQYCATMHPSRCKRSDIYKLCCATCHAHDTHVEGCRYGDDEGCARRDRAYCYMESVRTGCCDKCKRLRGNITGCEYGDRFQCTPNYCGDTRPEIVQGCCETCHKQTGR